MASNGSGTALPPPTSSLSVPYSPRGDPSRRPLHSGTVLPSTNILPRSGGSGTASFPSNIIPLRPLSPRRGDPRRRPLHSTVQPTSPVGAVREPPFPLQHHASPSPLPRRGDPRRRPPPLFRPPRHSRGISSPSNGYSSPTLFFPGRFGNRILPPPTSSLSVPSPHVGASLVVARHMRPCITRQPLSP